MDVNGGSLPANVLKEKDIMMYCYGVLKMDAYAKYVVNMGIWVDELFIELRHYIYI
jgi:SPX domain protein involved in polyphosphate accumulation